jgi:hypothetical protein
MFGVAAFVQKGLRGLLAGENLNKDIAFDMVFAIVTAKTTLTCMNRLHTAPPCCR